ncbi:hypothetical protein OEZ86_011910 [Tetradesmus obliquus]|nr:hypothetical protein OEZ86_011910 [Tetradesmus obliquus]
MPLTPNVDSISIAELQAAYVGFVKELSLASQLYEASALAGSSSGAEPQAWLQGQAPMERMEDTMCRFLQLFVSLFKVKRQGLVQQLCLTHLETGQLLQEPVQEHYTWVMPQLGLTPEQQQCIATGVRVFKRILTPSLLELRQLQLEDTATTPAAPAQQQQQQQQQQQHSSAAPKTQGTGDALHSMGKTADSSAAAAACPSQAAAAAAAAAAGSATSLAAAAAQGAAMSAEFAPLSAAHVAYRQRLDEQERRSARISVLLRKDFLHRICFCAYVYGCLSWPQQAKLHCLMWPYSPMVLITSETIAQMAPQGPPRRPRGRPRLHPRPE